MKLHELSPAEGSVRESYRKGRGPGSGNGKTAGKGHKGQNARSGGGVRPGFEGGQLPLYRKLPKRGFHNKFGKQFAIVDIEALCACGLVTAVCDGVKILGNGELTKKLTVKATVFSNTAKEKIEAVGGKTEVI